MEKKTILQIFLLIMVIVSAVLFGLSFTYMKEDKKKSKNIFIPGVVMLVVGFFSLLISRAYT